jgi:transposase
MTTSKVDTKVVIDFFNDFVKEINKPTVVVLDNASIHTSKLFKENISKWKQKGLELLYLPPYSPELNLIEILWKQMKYHHHRLDAYCSFDKLYSHVEKLLFGYGVDYGVNFA